MRICLFDDAVELDVGVEIRTDLGRSVALFTDGISFFVSVAVDGEAEDEKAEAKWARWKGTEELVALSHDPS